MEINMNDKKYLKWYQKLAYGSGDLASNCSYGLVSSFLLLYLSDVMGLKTNIIGTLMLVSKVFDGVTDVFFGNMIDKTKSRLGKARPWILISAPAILKNKYFYFVAALFILALSIASGNGSMTVYYCVNILKDMDMMTPLSMALTLPVIIGNCFVPAIVKKIGHQKTLILSSILMLVGFLIVAINPHSGTFAIVGMVVRGFGNGAIFACGFALAAIASLPGI